MKKYLLVFLLIAFIINTRSIFALSSYKLGGTTYYSDGTSSYNLGGTTYFSDGGSSYNLGGTTYYRDGSGNSGSAYNLGGTTYYNNSNGSSGSAYNLGGTTYVRDNNGNSGSAYNLGGTTYYNGDIFIAHNCPTNSSYDSLSSKCKCDSGYVVSGSSCVYKPYTPIYTPTYTPTYAPTYKPTYSPTVSSCPLNSHVSITDSTKCSCDSGYQTNSLKTACVIATPTIPIGTPTNTNNQACTKAYGLNSNWDGTKTIAGLLNCGCNFGYAWNSAKTACVVAETNTNNQACIKANGLNSNWDGTMTATGLLNCGCDSGYAWDSGKKACTFNTKLLIPGCTSTTRYSATTGISCATVITFPAGCASALGFSPTTGKPCH